MNVAYEQYEVRKSTNSSKTKTEMDQWQRRKAGTEILIRLLEQYSELEGSGIGKYFQRSTQKHTL